MDLLSSTGAEVRKIGSVRTEVSYKDGAIRPDLVGYDADGAESVIFEVKFWAKLFQGQVASYFKLLPRNQTSALLIVGPEVRREVLWAEILRQLGTERAAAPKDSNRVRSLAIPDGRWVMLTSWRVLLEALAERGHDVRGDVRQLQALCERQDDEAFGRPAGRPDSSPPSAPFCPSLVQISAPRGLPARVVAEQAHVQPRSVSRAPGSRAECEGRPRPARCRDPLSRHFGRFSRGFSTVESDMVYRQVRQIVQSRLNLDDCLP